jgi:hypothetical protein
MTMNGLRVLFLLIVVVGFAASAEACLRCYGIPGPPANDGQCGESPDGYCSGVCCGASIGDPCTIPDWLWPCYGVAQQTPLMARREAPRVPSTYFSSRQPVENVQVRFVARTRKCAASA